VLTLEIHAVFLGVDQRGLRLSVAHERLQLIQRHAAAEAGGGEGVAELMRIDSIKLNKKEGRRLMSWIGWVIVVVLGINFLLMGSMILWLLWRERTRKQ
jgi:hypothetical protein